VGPLSKNPVSQQGFVFLVYLSTKSIDVKQICIIPYYGYGFYGYNGIVLDGVAAECISVG